MSHIQKYTIVEHYDTSFFINEVNRLLLEGWELAGDIFVRKTVDGNTYLGQAMILLKSDLEFKTSEYID